MPDTAPIETEYLGVMEGYHCQRGWRREDGRLICCGYRAERSRAAPRDGEDVWFDTWDGLRAVLQSLEEVPQ